MEKTIEIPEGYEAALERCKQWVAGTSGLNPGASPKEVSEYIFPELAESEDEKISEWLIKFVEVRLPDAAEFEPEYRAALAWLERQKEQKPAEDKDAIEVTPKQDYSGLTDLERAIHRGFLCAGVENVPVGVIKETAQDCLAQIKSAEWSEEDEKMLKDVYESLYAYQCDIRAGIMDKNALELLKAVDKEKAWLKSLHPQSKVEWSEKDEKFFKTALWHISYSVSKGKTTDAHCDTTDWLKGVKERFESLRPSWKPSEEQINALERAIVKMHTPDDIGILTELRDILKKLSL